MSAEKATLRPLKYRHQPPPPPSPNDAISEHIERPPAFVVSEHFEVLKNPYNFLKLFIFPLVILMSR